MTQDKKDLFDIVVKHGSEKQAFLAVHANKTVLVDLEERISTITEKTIHMSMTLNSDILKKSLSSIGTIVTKEVPTATKFVQRKKRQSQVSIVHRQDLPSFIHKNVIYIAVTNGVKGITVNEKNELIIITYGSLWRHEIEIYDNNEKLKYKIGPVSSPTQIAFIPDKNIGIMTVSLDAIQFVDFTNRKIKNTVLIKGCQRGGVAASNDNIFVGTKGNISVLDLEGRFIRSIKMKNEKLTPKYIVLDKIGNIYHSDSEVVYCTRTDGENIFTFKPPDNKSPNAIAIDSQGYVYVVVQNQGVHRLRPDGTFNDLVDTLNEDLKGSFSDICFNKDCTKLYISKDNGVLVYNRQ